MLKHPASAFDKSGEISGSPAWSDGRAAAPSQLRTAVHVLSSGAVFRCWNGDYAGAQPLQYLHKYSYLGRYDFGKLA